MKKVLALLLVLVLAIGMFAACGTDSGNNEETKDTVNNATTEGGNDETKPSEENGNNTEGKTLKVGMICIGDENDQGYTYNFYAGRGGRRHGPDGRARALPWTGASCTKHPARTPAAPGRQRRAGRGTDCDVVISNSYGHEPVTCSRLAPDYPKVAVHRLHQPGLCRLPVSDNCPQRLRQHLRGPLPVAGVAAGMKLQADASTPAPSPPSRPTSATSAAFPFAEVVSGYTAFYHGAQRRASLCHHDGQVRHLLVRRCAQEAAAAAGPVPMRAACSSPSTPTTPPPPRSAQQNGVFHCRLQQRHDRRGPRGHPASPAASTGPPYFDYAV